MNENEGLLSSGWSRVMRNKRYIFWFYILNVLLAWFGAGAFNNQVHQILDHSLHANRLVNGFDLGVLMETFSRPEFGPKITSAAPAMHFAFFFLLMTALFLPGVLQGYASTYRLPREDFFRACGRNLWRFIRLMIVAGIVMGAVAAALFGLHGVLERKAAESTNELLLPEVQFAGLVVIFLVMTALRIWFDLAQTDVVLSDQRAVRKSIGSGFRHMWRSLGRLLGSYLVTTIVAAIILVAGLWVWMKSVPPDNIVGAVVVSQLILLFLLIPRFWQRGVVVSYYLHNMVEPIAVQPFAPAPVAAPAPTPVIQSTPPETQGA
ncbi:MAG TPA: hypothetical protein VJX47_11900 [Candidatus Sulfotelmatobacter sp.]|nr:hypothetical protein [Candidatus Sulfotelmatobacter sp.]